MGDEILEETIDGGNDTIVTALMASLTGTTGYDYDEDLITALEDRITEQPVDVAANMIRGEVRLTSEDIDKLIPKFMYRPRNVILKTLENTTLLAKQLFHHPGKKFVKSRYPQLNRKRIYEVISTDTIFSSVKAFTGEEAAQIFVGNESAYMNVFGLMSEAGGATAFEDFIRTEGAPLGVRRDNSMMQ